MKKKTRLTLPVPEIESKPIPNPAARSISSWVKLSFRGFCHARNALCAYKEYDTVWPI